MDLSKLEGAFSDPTDQFYLCGPVGFMQFAAKQLVDLGVKQENIHYECFWPHKGAVIYVAGWKHPATLDAV